MLLLAPSNAMVLPLLMTNRQMPNLVLLRLLFLHQDHRDLQVLFRECRVLAGVHRPVQFRLLQVQIQGLGLTLTAPIHVCMMSRRTMLGLSTATLATNTHLRQVHLHWFHHPSPNGAMVPSWNVISTASRIEDQECMRIASQQRQYPVLKTWEFHPCKRTSPHLGLINRRTQV